MCELQVGMNALLTAAEAGAVEIMEMLLEHGADIHAKDRVRKTETVAIQAICHGPWVLGCGIFCINSATRVDCLPVPQNSP
jgi:ankyrin repeat protein